MMGTKVGLEVENPIFRPEFRWIDEKSNILKAQFITDPKDHAEKRGEQYTVTLPHPRQVGCGPWSLTKDCGRPRR